VQIYADRFDEVCLLARDKLEGKYLNVCDVSTVQTPCSCREINDR